MDRKSLIKNLQDYTTTYEDELKFIPLFLDLLSEESCFDRSNFKRHITGSAWIVSYNFQKALLLHHKKLNRWLQPGGHADGNENILEVAKKEALEETGLKAFKMISPQIFDIDIHVIPSRKETPEHYHYDIRFLLQANKNASIAKNDESHEVAWINLKELNRFTANNTSIQRMAEKTKNCFISTKN